ncbi:Protein of unknown function [Weissella confusa LBAE C39-2]|nr:Protein of unknown function [Weissella confusa LBAE C39-2]
MLRKILVDKEYAGI